MAEDELNIGREQSSLPDKLLKLESLDELSKLVGDLTPEEQQLLSSINFNAPPTPEELEFLGPDFTRRVIDKAINRRPL